MFNDRTWEDKNLILLWAIRYIYTTEAKGAGGQITWMSVKKTEGSAFAI